MCVCVCVCVCVGVFYMYMCVYVFMCVCVCVGEREVHSLHTHIALFEDTRETVVRTPQSFCACKVALLWSIHTDSLGQ